MSKLEKILISFYLFLLVALFIFSFAYVDLNLTISQNRIVLDFVSFMQKLGFYQRPLASLIYITLIFLFFSFFVLNLVLFYRQKIGMRFLKYSILVSSAMLVFAYPFLSSDLFNYLFDAKIITTYGQNPYTHRPLDFPQDEWLRFMRWTHRFSPYGPLWLLFSTVPSILALGKFILNFVAFKLFILLFHLINCFLIYKISKKILAEKALMATAFYAINPLVLIEGVVNAHNDVVLATFLILPTFFATKSKTYLSYLSVLLGIFVKYVPVLILPFLVIYHRSGWKNIRPYLIYSLLAILTFTVIYSTFEIELPFFSGSTQTQFQPWYLLWAIPFVALINNRILMMATVIISFGALIRYLPFLYFGDWSHPGTLNFMLWAVIIPVILSLLGVLLVKLKKINE